MHVLSLRVAIVTPHYREPAAWLARCLESVRQQTMPCAHFVVDDGGDPCPEAEGVHRIALPRAHGDMGDTARAVGAVCAIGEGFDAVAWLDADNWFLPRHVETMLAAHARTGAAVVTSGRMLHRRDGNELGPCYEVDGDDFVDSNCMLFMRAAFPLVAAWYLMRPEDHVIGDRVVWRRIRSSGLEHAHTGLRTVAYRTPYRVHYEAFGEGVPEDVKERIVVPAGKLR